MNGKLYEYGGVDEIYEGYLSSLNAGTGPGLILLQEWWGLVPHILEVADRYAAAGFNVLAPDLYRGETTDEPDDAATLMMALNVKDTSKLLAKAAELLLTHKATSSDKIGVIGFCMGGQLSLFAACDNPSIGACIDYYGIHPEVKPVLENLNCPLLGFFAETDPYAGPEQVKSLDEELTRLGKAHEFITYPGTKHAFFNNDRPAYNKEAAEDSWNRSIRFLNENLRA